MTRSAGKPKPSTTTPPKATAPAATKPPIQLQRRTGTELPPVQPVARDRPINTAAPGLNDTMNRHLGTWSGAGQLAHEMARVSNDPQFRQNPDESQHAAIRAMGQQRDNPEFRRTIGDTARSRAFGGLDDPSQLQLMNRLGGADRAAGDAYQQMWRSDEFQHANLAGQVGQLREFERRQNEAEQQAREARDRGERRDGVEDRRQADQEHADLEAHRRLDALPADQRGVPANQANGAPESDHGPLPPGALLRAAKEGARRVLPSRTQDAPARTPPAPPVDGTRVPPQPVPARDHNGFNYRTGADGRSTLPSDASQATPRRFLEDQVLPTLRGATNADGSARYPESVQEMERTLERMRRAEANGELTTEWERNGSSWAAGRYDANGDLVGTRAAVNAQLVQEWNNIEEAVRAGRLDPAQRLPHLHETAGRFMEDLSHEFAHRQGLRSQERIFDPSSSREENVRRLTDDALADEASRARNGHRTESVFARESDRAGGHRPQRDHSMFQRALDDVRAGRLSPGEAQQRVIDEVAGLQPGGHPPGTTYRDLYGQNAEIEYDRMMARHQARAADPNARPAQDPNGRPAQDPNAVRRAAPGDLPARWQGEVRDVLRSIPEGGMPLDEFMGRLGARELLDHPELANAIRNVRGPDGSTRIMVDHRHFRDQALAISQFDPDGTARMTFDRGLYAGPEGHVPPAMRTLAPEIAAAHEVFDMDYMRRAADTWRLVEDDTMSFPDRYRQPVEDMLSRVRQENPEVINRMIDEDIRMYGRDGLFREFKDGRYADFNRQAELFRARTPQAAADLQELRTAVWDATSKHRVMDYFRESNTYARQMDLYDHARAVDPRYQSPAMEQWTERIRSAADPMAERARIIEENLIRSDYVSREQADVFRRYEQMLPDELRATGRLAPRPHADAAPDGRVSGGDRPPPNDAPQRPAPGGMDDPNRPGSGAQRGREIADDVVRHKHDEGHRNGPEGRPADPLHPDVRGALNRDVAAGLSQDDLQRVGTLTEDAGARRSISDLLRNARTPEEARQISSTLEGVPAGSRQAVAQAIGAMGQGDLTQVHRMMQGLPAESREALGRVLGNIGTEQGADFLRIAQHLEGRELSEAMGIIDTAVSNLRRHAPGMLDHVGRMFTAMNQMVGRMGLQMSQVAGRVLRGVGAMLPAVGTAFSAYDFARMTRVAADGTLPAELRFLGGAGMALNGLDTALGVSEMFGIGNIGLPANLALGAAALGLDLYTHHQIDQFRQNPNGWQPSRGLNAFVAGTALAMGPTGAALLVGTFGASGAQEKMIDLGAVGGELAINAARLGGVAMADGVGGQMRFTARGIDAMADMIRHPERFGEAMQRLGVGAQQLAQNALGALGNAAQYAGELGQRATRAIGQAGNWLVERGAEGLETLRWMARPENWPAMGAAAQRGITEMIRRGGELGRAAWDGLQDLGARGVEIGRSAITALQNAGERGLEMLNHAYRRFRDDPSQAFRDLGNAAIDGISNLARQGGELGQRAVRSLIDWVDDQPRLAQRAINSLRDLATEGGQALDEIANAWGRNLTEGGRALLGSLENLGNAGAEALGRLGARGGALAMEAATSLGRMVNRGYDAATQALQRVAGTLTPENLQRFLIDQPARAARAVFDSLGGRRIAEMLNGLRDAPDTLRRLYDQMDWRHVRDTFGRLGDQAMSAMVGALDPRRLRELIGHFDGGMLRRVWDGMTSWDGARRLFEAAGEGLTRKLADAIGSHNLAGLVNAANVSVDWIRTHLAQTLNSMQGFGEMLQHATADGLRKLRDVVGVDRIAGTLRQMRDAGIQFGENLVNNARALGDQAIQEAMGLVQAAQQHVEHVANSYRGGRIVHPLHPDAVWWIGRNPFRR